MEKTSQIKTKVNIKTDVYFSPLQIMKFCIILEKVIQEEIKISLEQNNLVEIPTNETLADSFDFEGCRGSSGFTSVLSAMERVHFLEDEGLDNYEEGAARVLDIDCKAIVKKKKKPANKKPKLKKK